MRYAIVADQKVVNVVLANEALGDDWVQTDAAQIGDVYVDGQFEKPPLVPAKINKVTPRQARIVLSMQAPTDEQYPHMLAQLEAMFAEFPEPQKTLTQITWEYSTFVERSNPLIAEVQNLIGYTDEQIDHMFSVAATL